MILSVTRYCLKALEKDPRPGMSRVNMMVTEMTAGGDGGGVHMLTGTCL